MSDLRKDPIVGCWVIIAPNRAKRPEDFKQNFDAVSHEFCPFCAGHEDTTPNEILAYRQPGSTADDENWRVRVVPNKFPALVVEGELNKQGEGIYDKMNGIGAHEVIIESPKHITSITELELGNIREVLWVYRDRLVDLKRDPRLVHGLIFKNKGTLAGASLEHSHSQLIATPVVPITIWEEMTGALEFYNYRGRCIYCDIIQQEISLGKRVVMDTPNFLVICPYASRFPFETWILPKQHSSQYENIPHQSIEELGTVIKTVLSKLELALDNPPYNYVIHTAPFDNHELPHYHWHLEIFPRITRVAGFEWGTGFYINSVPPEDAASFLRDTDVDI